MLHASEMTITETKGLATEPSNTQDIPVLIILPPLPEGGGGILFYLCPSFRPSKIFFVAFFSVTVDGRNLIFGHKCHIGISYCG
jgi:hypothetical protein